MKVTRQIRTRLKLQNSAFIVLFLTVVALLAYISKRHNYEADWTQQKRHTLSKASADLLASIEQPIKFTVYATEDDDIRKPINSLLKRYARAKSTITIEFINPELEPQLMRELGVSVNGEVSVALSGRQENIQQVSEHALTNAIQRLARSEERWFLFVQGHGERKISGKANHDLGEWGKQLQAKGIKLQGFNLAENPIIPQNIAALVIASPQLDYLPGEVAALKNYIDDGGNLLWFVEPGSLNNLAPLAKALDIDFQPGTIVDPNTQLLGINDPRFSLVSEYSPHAITANMNALTLYPQARGLTLQNTESWQRTVLLQTLPRSWAETGPLSGQLNYDSESDINGPLVLAVAMTRSVEKNITQATSAEERASGASHDADTPLANEPTEQAQTTQQRVIVVGDGDFVSNAYLGNGANLQLGLSMINWLGYDDQFISIPAKTGQDIQLELSRNAQLIIAFSFLLLVPLLLAGSGFMIWFRRRQY